jgi:putative endonuclease
MIPPPACQGGADSPPRAYVYLLRSEQTHRFYLGWTTSLERRLEAHRQGISPYTRSRGPWRLVGYETHPSSHAAKDRERQLKLNPRMLMFFKKRMMNAMRRTADGGPSQVVG